ncbi:schlafen-like protein 1 isoform X1 [Hypanus sabinus]|uniref:schlafen-like protein 1 isoform X1 n=1 Tax=Hypanus sabinus TaxID=79690 RepID=UPI0028C43275|nr:schlafen-like protein 1 isoform X1 [Hypanus sabinus]XP_059805202.1 schlafen-like protein 1 isoform X1 [Hypanus sabinus]
MDDDSVQTPCLSVFVGNLNPDYSKEQLSYRLKDLFASVDTVLQRHDIEVFKKHKRAHAYIRLKTDSEVQKVLRELQDPGILELNDMKGLVVKGKTLKVAKDIREFSEHTSDKSSSADPLKQESHSQQQKDKRRLDQTQETSGGPSGKSMQLPSKIIDHLATPLIGTKSDSAIMGGEIAGQERLFYGTLMGSETRNVEFKRGGGEYLNVTLKNHIRKYICAFLNSEGGSLFVGVNDDGTVCGVECSHKDEDRVRLLIDSILKGFKPPLFPTSYSISFLPVIKDGDTGLFLKVVRLTVHPPSKDGDIFLYETDQGEVYIRRDGSVQGPLTGSSIQEWCRQKWTAEVKKLQGIIDTLVKEEYQLQEELRQQQQNLQELQQLHQELQAFNSDRAAVSNLCCVI